MCKFPLNLQVLHRLPFLPVVDMEAGSVGDMGALGVVESYRVKQAMLTSAAEAAEMILRVDDIIKSRPRIRNPEEEQCM